MKWDAEIKRNTAETDISLKVKLKGKGISDVDTGIPFLDHMLQLMTTHGFMDLELKARGDTQVDDHHTVEDIGICFGRALKQAFSSEKDLSRYGEATVPMDEALCRVVIDISNRPFFAYRVKLGREKTGTFDVGLIREFFRALVMNAGITLHVDLLDGEDPHHVAEVIFKSFGKALDRATSPEPRLEGRTASTKGIL